MTINEIIQTYQNGTISWKDMHDQIDEVVEKSSATTEFDIRELYYQLHHTDDFIDQRKMLFNLLGINYQIENSGVFRVPRQHIEATTVDLTNKGGLGRMTERETKQLRVWIDTLFEHTGIELVINQFSDHSLMLDVKRQHIESFTGDIDAIPIAAHYVDELVQNQNVPTMEIYARFMHLLNLDSVVKSNRDNQLSSFWIEGQHLSPRTYILKTQGSGGPSLTKDSNTMEQKEVFIDTLEKFLQQAGLSYTLEAKPEYLWQTGIMLYLPEQNIYKRCLTQEFNAQPARTFHLDELVFRKNQPYHAEDSMHKRSIAFLTFANIECNFHPGDQKEIEILEQEYLGRNIIVPQGRQVESRQLLSLLSILEIERIVLQKATTGAETFSVVTDYTEDLKYNHYIYIPRQRLHRATYPFQYDGRFGWNDPSGNTSAIKAKRNWLDKLFRL